MIFSRTFAFPTKDTFSCPPIGAFVRRYLKESTISVDCFARNNTWCTFTNDLNPNTEATYHLDVRDFLKVLSEQNIVADLIVFDPPFSPTQMGNYLSEFGEKMSFEKGKRTCGWTPEKALVDRLLGVGGVYLQFGWGSHGMNSSGFSGYVIEEILLVCHGPGTPDTICMAERKVDGQLELFQSTLGLSL